MKKKRFARGENFLSNIGIDRLRVLCRKETNAKARNRLLTYVYKKEDKSIREIGRVFGQAYFITHDWLIRTDQAGFEMLYDIPNLELPCRLTSKQLADLKEDLITGPQMHGFESEMWTGKMMVEHARIKYNIGYVPHNAAVDA